MEGALLGLSPCIAAGFCSPEPVFSTLLGAAGAGCGGIRALALTLHHYPPPCQGGDPPIPPHSSFLPLGFESQFNLKPSLSPQGFGCAGASTAPRGGCTSLRAVLGPCGGFRGLGKLAHPQELGPRTPPWIPSTNHPAKPGSRRGDRLRENKNRSAC